MLTDAVLLYKLIHQRYILSKQGLQEMTEKYEAGDFGTCPRHLCRGQPLLPVGLSALPATASCKVYCLNCQDLYTPASRIHAQADGVAFGPTFAHFMVRNVLFLDAEKAVAGRGSQRWDQFVPKIYGFRIADRADKVDLRSFAPRDYQ
jgi:casein kinase II subunit beta